MIDALSEHAPLLQDAPYLFSTGVSTPAWQELRRRCAERALRRLDARALLHTSGHQATQAGDDGHDPFERSRCRVQRHLDIACALIDSERGEHGAAPSAHDAPRSAEMWALARHWTVRQPAAEILAQSSIPVALVHNGRAIKLELQAALLAPPATGTGDAAPSIIHVPTPASALLMFDDPWLHTFENACAWAASRLSGDLLALAQARPATQLWMYWQIDMRPLWRRLDWQDGEFSRCPAIDRCRAVALRGGSASGAFALLLVQLIKRALRR